MRNNRDGTFRDVTAESGLNQNNTRYSFCCGWNDYNRDGWPDLYVVNDFGRKNLYRNNGDGTFTDVAAAIGSRRCRRGHERVLVRLRQRRGRRSLRRQHVDGGRRAHHQRKAIFRKDAPGRCRAISTASTRWAIRLFRGPNRGNQHFRSATEPLASEMGRWSWSSDAWDFDHDGFPDLYVTNGMVSGPVALRSEQLFLAPGCGKFSRSKPKPAQDYEQGWNALNELLRSDGTWSGYERNVFYANNRDGTFSDVSAVVGLDFRRRWPFFRAR